MAAWAWARLRLCQGVSMDLMQWWFFVMGCTVMLGVHKGTLFSTKVSFLPEKKSRERGVRTLHLSNVRITSNGLLKILLALFECGTRGSCTLRTFMVELLPYESRSFLQMQ